MDAVTSLPGRFLLICRCDDPYQPKDCCLARTPDERLRNEPLTSLLPSRHTFPYAFTSPECINKAPQFRYKTATGPAKPLTHVSYSLHALTTKRTSGVNHACPCASGGSHIVSSIIWRTATVRTKGLHRCLAIADTMLAALDLTASSSFLLSDDCTVALV